MSFIQIVNDEVLVKLCTFLSEEFKKKLEKTLQNDQRYNIFKLNLIPITFIFLYYQLIV